MADAIVGNEYFWRRLDCGYSCFTQAVPEQSAQKDISGSVDGGGGAAAGSCGGGCSLESP